MTRPTTGPSLRLQLLLAFSLLLVISSAQRAQAGASTRLVLVVVVAKDSSATSISRNDLRRIFLGEKLTIGGAELVPFNFNPGTPERQAFDQMALHMSPAQVGQFWVDRKVRGQGQPPRALPSLAHVLKVTAKYPGAVAYVSVDRVTADVKVLKVDGKGPTDAGYALVFSK